MHSGGSADAGHGVGGRAFPQPVLLLDERVEDEAAVPVHLGTDLPCAAHLRGGTLRVVTVPPPPPSLPLFPVLCPISILIPASPSLSHLYPRPISIPLISTPINPIPTTSFPITLES